MITKLIFTVLVVLGVFAFMRARDRRTARVSQTTVEPAGTTVSPRVLAYTITGVIIVVSLVLFFLQWQDARSVATIRVINSLTGDATTYQAHRDRIGGRSFETLDGRTITLADVDRMEVVEE